MKKISGLLALALVALVLCPKGEALPGAGHGRWQKAREAKPEKSEEKAATARASSISHLSIVLNDESRKKQLRCRLTFPENAAGHCPVFIFSHGALGSGDSYDYLIDYLASRGYVCVQPTHDDSLSLVSKMGRLQQARSVLKELPQNAPAWENRARDISFIIDSMPVIEGKLPVALAGDQIACGGHSFGAFTTALIAGAMPPPPAVQASCSDRRVRAAVMMSPQGVRHSLKDFGFADKQAWLGMKGPCLFMTGTLDKTSWTEAGDRTAAFASCPPGDKYMAIITGAAHMTFSGEGNGVMVGDLSHKGARSGPLRRGMTAMLSKSMTPDQGDRAAMCDDICRITLAFLDTYLKNDRTSRSALLKPESFGTLVDLQNR